MACLDRVNEGLKLNAQCLNLEERTELDLALKKLKTETSHHEIQFWGKIEGTVKDYHIALGLDFVETEDSFLKKSFYWCSSRNFNYAQLPVPTETSSKAVNEINTGFTGEYDTILAPGEDTGKEIWLDENDPLPVQVKSKPVTELDRLAHVVHRIENECHIVPEGAYKLIHEVKPNEAFSGLSKEDAMAPQSDKYVHFRPVSNPAKKAQLERGDSILRADWLDPISEDCSKGSWTIKSDTTGSVALIRNLRWPGYSAWHRANTSQYGSFYFGDGKLNKDLAFML